MMNTNTALTFPTVHMNGTGRQDLLDQYLTAANAVTAARHALHDTYPNGRDYYPQGPEAIQHAMNEHEARLERLAAVRAELLALAEAVADAGRK
jgi:hypothetical protein